MASRFLLTCDLHVKAVEILHKPRLPVGRQLLFALIDKALELRCSHIILLGDVWHVKSYANPEVLLVVYEFLEKAREVGLRVVVIPGNHDVFRPGTENQSVLKVFNHGAVQIVSTPKISHLKGDDGVDLYMLPWYEADTYKERLAELKQHAREDKKIGRMVVLLTHVGLSEGKPSLSNFQPPQRVSIADIDPKLWDLVLMGDYHMHQKLAPNVMYLGAPIPHTFGDEGNVGFWLLTVDKGEIGIECVGPPKDIPQFDRFVIDSPAGINVPYKKANYTKIECVPELYERVRRMYPEAEVLPLRTAVVVDESNSRISADLLDDYPALLDRYFELQRIPKERQTRLKTRALGLLKKARES